MHRTQRRFLTSGCSSPRWSHRDLRGFAVIALRAMRDVPTYCQVQAAPLGSKTPLGTCPIWVGILPEWVPTSTTS